MLPNSPWYLQKKNQRQKQKKAKRSQTSNDGIAELNLLLVAFRIQQETIIAVQPRIIMYLSTEKRYNQASC